MRTMRPGRSRAIRVAGTSGVVAVVLGVGGAGSVRAGTFTWDPTKSGPWSVGANWQGGVAPSRTGPTSLLQFGGSTAYTSSNDINGNNFVINRLRLFSTGGTPTIDAPNGGFISLQGVNPAVVQDGTGPFLITSQISILSPTAFGG